MDRVRFGRALGYGARHAAKTLMKAADAASTPTRTEARKPAAQASQAPPARVAERVVQTQRTVAATTQHAGRLGRSVWTPVARFSSVVWLQVTGLFFALIAMFLAQGAWKERAAWHQPLASHGATKFYVLVGAFAAFAYFSVSNFVRAYLRERR
jgi:cation transport ATPase